MFSRNKGSRKNLNNEGSNQCNARERTELTKIYDKTQKHQTGLNFIIPRSFAL